MQMKITKMLIHFFSFLSEGGKAIILYATDNSANADVRALELSAAEVQEVIAKYSKAKSLQFDSEYFSHLEGKTSVFKLNGASEILTCDCKAKPVPTTPKPTTTTPKPTTTTPKPTTTPKKPELKTPATTPGPTYLPPAPTKPPGTPATPGITKKGEAETPPPRTTPSTTKKSTPGPPYLPIVRKETTEGPKYSYVPRTYTYGTVPTYTYNFNWTYAPGTYTPNTRTYTRKILFFISR